MTVKPDAASAELESCDSGLSDSASGVTPPPVETGLEAGARPGAPMEDDEDSLSGLSDISGQDWKPDMSPKLAWLQAAMRRGENPKDILVKLLPSGSEISDSLDNMTMWKVLFNLLSEPPRRKKLDTINTIEDCVEMIRKSRNIIILTGAGVSVSCGIPDFRSRDGVYARLAVDFPDLPDPQAMFDIEYFKKDPRPFFKFAREIYPGQFQPSPCHKFIRCVESNGKLLRNFTQNIDTLEQVAGIQNVIQCHGSFATASCMACKRKVDAEVIRQDIFKQTIPKCGICPEPESEPGPELPFLIGPPPAQMPIMKPDIVFFGEGLPDHFHECISRDKSECDLLIVIGSSLKVRPVALIPSSLPPEVPQILINREPLPHLTFDVELYGDCDRIVNQLCLMLTEDSWASPVHSPILTQHTGLPEISPDSKANVVFNHYQKQNSMDNGDFIKPTEEQAETLEKASDVENNTACETENDKIENSVQKVNLTIEPSTSKIENKNMEDESDDEEGEEWKVKTLSDYIPEGQFLYLPPSRYVFAGAELPPDADIDSSDDEEDEDLEDNERNENEEDGDTGEHEIVSEPHRLESETEEAALQLSSPIPSSRSDKVPDES